MQDAEGLAVSEDGVLFLACQRGLFLSRDNGTTWKHEKFDSSTDFWLELTGIATIPDGIALASKNGLFLWRSSTPKLLVRVESLGAARVSMVAFHSKGSLVVALEDCTLRTVDTSTGASALLGSIPASLGEISALFFEDGQWKVLAKHGFVGFRAGTPVQEDLPSEIGPWHGTSAAGGLLAWNTHEAWIRRVGNWQRVESWPAGVRKAAMATCGSYIIATDRRTIFKIPLQPVEAVSAV